MTEIHVGVPAGESTKPETMGYGNWSILTLWERMADEEDSQSFEQRITLIDPLGTVRVETVTPFDMKKLEHRILGTIQGFPFSPAGTYTLSLHVRRTGKHEWGSEVTAFPLRLVHEIGVPNATLKEENQTEAQSHDR